MERNVVVICSVVGVLGLLLAVTGFSAEGTRVKSVPSATNTTCSYPRSPAYGLGITASACLILAQIVISAASRCTCCCSKGPHRSSSCWTLAIVFFVISWFASIFAALALLGAGLLNDDYDVSTTNNQNSGYFNDYYCPVVRSGVFAGMTILGLISIVLGLTYYIILSSASKALPTSQVGVAMGQPQFHPGGQDPVFVHEDTYARRQVV